MHDKIFTYVSSQLGQAENSLRAYVFDQNGDKYPTRNIIVLLRKYFKDFSYNIRSPRWVAVSGLRGVGKTTALAQMYSDLSCPPNRKIYISLDHTNNVLNVRLQDILEVYEEILGEPFENLSQPVYLFIDEVQYEENWGLILKSLYDRSNKVFLLLTGSSAISLQTNADVSRRLVIEKLFPMSFTEYILMKMGKKPTLNLASELRGAIYLSENAREVYKRLEALRPKVMRYWVGIDRLEMDKYLKYGTLPFALQLNSEPLIYKQIEQLLSNIQFKDIPQVKAFRPETLSKMNQMLYIIASSETIAIPKIANLLSLTEPTVLEMLDVLEKSEVLLKVQQFGSAYTQVKVGSRRPSKYLYYSSAYRAMFFNLAGNIIDYDNYKGRLLEDNIGLCMQRYFDGKIVGFITHDANTSGGADFIVGVNDHKIAVEVGYGQKDFSQVKTSMQRVGAKYGLSISMDRLYLNEEETAVSVPLSYALLT